MHKTYAGKANEGPRYIAVVSNSTAVCARQRSLSTWKLQKSAHVETSQLWEGQNKRLLGLASLASFAADSAAYSLAHNVSASNMKLLSLFVERPPCTGSTS